MMRPMDRRRFTLGAASMAGGALSPALLAAAAAASSSAHAQSAAQSPARTAAATGAAGRPVVLGMTLEPNGLDPTTGAASAIAEVVLYNVLEPLTKVADDGSATPLLATAWTSSPDQKTWTFQLRPNVRFHNGEPFNAATVRFSFERAAADNSLNKDRRVFANIASIQTPDPLTVMLTLRQPEPDLPALLAQSTAVIVEPRSAATNAQTPVGTGPYRLERWQRGASLSLTAWPDYRDAAAIRVPRVVFRFIGEPAAQVAALLAGDVDCFPRVAAARALSQFKAQPQRFQVITSSSRAKTILAINHQRAPLGDVRVRRAIVMALDRQAIIQASADGFGVPIGSYVTPDTPGYVDCTGINAYNPAAARKLLEEAKAVGLSLTLKLPPVPYARQAGELIVAQLAQVGLKVRIEQVEWAQWLSGVYTNKAYDLTVISHVEPYDFGNLARPGYYWGYQNAEFNALYQRMQSAADPAERLRLFADAQRLVAQDAVAGFLYQPQWITVAKAPLKGVWKRSPLFANDLSRLSW
ncbi:peptide/nickel transport system substrate-binding protein [Roseateles depolymerans]|uniref:Putative binding protein yliB n=2 Tax=Roseateles depolymerans TaxID=76731 RepID=A0A0U3LEA7_9BURK|nr:Putative binding protein yliB [Roseateles depolymerans]REG15187.1 peptide/nickel transport system substrate-binding protein [Roseateles depolymerans]